MHPNYSKGISWIDDCRIPFVENDGWGTRHNKEYPEWKGAKNFTHPEQILSQDTRGRFPANLLVCDDMLNDGVISKSVKNKSKGSIRKGNVIGDNRTPIGAGLFGDGSWIERNNFNDKGTNSRYYDIDKWFEKLLDV
jgi:hypothetical protein